jgi:hypothetical protein
MQNHLLRSAAGLEILGVGGPPRGPLVGTSARVLTALICTHLLTGLSYDDLLGNANICTELIQACSSDQWRFVLPSAEVRSWRSKHPETSHLRAYEQLLDAFFIFSPRYSQLPNNVSLANVAHVMSQLSTDLYRSALRHENQRTYPDQSEARPLTWWFVTVSHEHGALFREAFPSPLDFFSILPYASRMCIAECEQRVPHIHGIFQCSVPVTQRLMQNALRDYGWLTIEPIHTSPAASATYILHQKTGVLWEIPDPWGKRRSKSRNSQWGKRRSKVN